MSSLVTPAQLVQLAEFNLRSARRRRVDKLEALWLGLQSVVLLETALDRIPPAADRQVSVATPAARLHTPSRESIHTKLANAKNDLHGFLKAVIITTNENSGLEEFKLTTDDALVSDWLKDMLDYFKEKFTNKTSRDLKTLNEGQRMESIRKEFSRSCEVRRASAPARPLSQVQPSATSESVRDKISYHRMMMNFTTATAAKYGVNVLDKFSSKAIDDYRNANVSSFSDENNSNLYHSSRFSSRTQPTVSMRRRSTSIINESRPMRPTSLNLENTLTTQSRSSSLSNRINSVVSDLKSRADKLRHRNSMTSPVVPWQTAIKQHKSMISEILNDFNDGDRTQDQITDNNPAIENDPPDNDMSPDQFLQGLSNISNKYNIRRTSGGSIDSVQYSYGTTTKTVKTQVFENGLETFREEQSETLDSNGNRHEIYRRGSILDNDVKVTYARSGSLTPDASAMAKVLERRSYSLHSFEPVSPLTEICSIPWSERTSPDSETPTPEVAGSVSISEDDILRTLANSVLEIANKTFEEHNYEQAQGLYEQALAILNRMYKFSGKFEPSIIPTMKQCGMIRKFRGDSLGAMGIFEQCIGVIEKRENGHCSTEYRVLIAELWFEMGNALIIEGKHTETIGHSVISIMRERETADFIDAPRSVSSDMDLEYSYNAYTTKGQSYPVGAFEALSCYKKSYCKIENLKSENGNGGEFCELSGKVLLKIGDCSILIGDLEVGTNFYESALDCFKTTDTPYSLCDNAHVLVMMGFLQYISARYSKALVMLQCATIMFHRLENNGQRYEKSEFAMVKSLICFTNFETEDYSKAVSMGIQAKRIYDELFDDEMELANKAYTWLIAQTMFMVARSYYSMRMHDRAIGMLQELTDIFGPKSNMDTILRVRILELWGLCHEALEQGEEALDMYNRALEVYRGQTNYGYTSSVLEHTLLSRTAGLHVSMQQYDEAALCLDPAYASRDLEEDIRSDMVTLLHHLGETHTLAGHVDRAIDCYQECVDVYLEIHGTLGPEIVKTLGKLANMYHVKAVQSHHQDKDSLFAAEKFYRQAMDIDFPPVLALRYANFLFHQRSLFEALYILQQLLETEMELKDITFAGVEQVLLPVLLQCECDDDELTIAGKLLIRYLLVLACCAIGKLRSAEYYLLDMIYEADESDTLGLSVIGYSLLELRMYAEAYVWFDLADRSSSYPASTVAWENKLFCVCLELFRTLRRGFLFMYEHVHGIGNFPSDYPYIT